MLASEPALRNFNGESDATAAEDEALRRAFNRAFTTVDEEILQDSRGRRMSDGSTCLVLLRVGACSAEHESQPSDRAACCCCMPRIP